VTELVKHDSVALSNHALGLLDEPEARALEAHLAGCAACCQEWEQVRDTVALLDEHVPEEFFDTGRADSTDLLFHGRILRAVRKDKRSQARRRLLRPLAAAAAVILVALGGAFAVGRASAPESPPAILQVAGARTVHGTGVGGASLQATVAPAASGDTVQLLVNAAGLPRGAHCQLLVVTADGRRELAGSWTVPAGGPIQGSAAVNMTQVRAVAVADADTGRELAYLQV
jgi:anti-sigma factor RsiW